MYLRRKSNFSLVLRYKKQVRLYMVIMIHIASIAKQNNLFSVRISAYLIVVIGRKLGNVNSSHVLCSLRTITIGSRETPLYVHS